MSNIFNPLKKGWIIRLFREARSDISASYDIEEPFISANLIIQSMKKMLKVLNFCLGDLENIEELLFFRINSSDQLYNLLFSFQNIINYWIQKNLSFEEIDLSEILLDAKYLYNFTMIKLRFYVE